MTGVELVSRKQVAMWFALTAASTLRYWNCLGEVKMLSLSLEVYVKFSVPH